MKKVKLETKRLPVDCIGVILEFISSTKTFFNVYLLSNHVKWYVDNEHPGCTINVQFNYTNNKNKINGVKEFIYNVYLEEEVELANFPNVSILDIDFNVTYSNVQNIKYLKNLSYLEINLKSESLKNKRYFDNFSHINELHLKYGDYSDEDFIHLSKVQILFLNRYECTRKITGEGFCHLKKIKKIKIKHGSLSPNSLIHLKNVEKIKLCWVKNITNYSFRHLSNVKKLRIDDYNGLTIEGYKHLKNCVSLDLSSNDSITNEVIKHFSTMKNLKELNVMFISEISSSFISKLKNLTKLKIGSMYG
jgi:hypothetical protein